MVENVTAVFFVNYGFSLEDNEDNEASLIFELSKNDQQYALKAKYLGFNSLDHAQKEFQIPRQYKEKKSERMFFLVTRSICPTQ